MRKGSEWWSWVAFACFCKWTVLGSKTVSGLTPEDCKGKGSGADGGWRELYWYDGNGAALGPPTCARRKGK